MKTMRWVLSLAIAIPMLSLSLPVRAQSAVLSPSLVFSPEASARSAARMDSLIDAIGDAQDPSTAIAEYAKAQAEAPGHVFIERAYISRMVEFGLPEMVNAQARNEIRNDPNNALAWAVAAYVDGVHNQTHAALKEIANAARLLPEHPFIQTTAAKLLAWYDNAANQARMPDDVKNAVAATRQQVAKLDVYSATYQKASTSYPKPGNAQQPPTTIPATAAIPPRMTDDDEDQWALRGPATIYNTYGYGGSYGWDPYGYGDWYAPYYPIYDTAWPTLVYPRSWWVESQFWWPLGTSPFYLLARDRFFDDRFFLLNRNPVFFHGDRDRESGDGKGRRDWNAAAPLDRASRAALTPRTRTMRNDASAMGSRARLNASPPRASVNASRGANVSRGAAPLRGAAVSRGAGGGGGASRAGGGGGRGR